MIVRLPDFTIHEINVVSPRAAAGYTSWGVDALEAPRNWSKGHDGTGVIVFVLDTEGGTDHPSVSPYIELPYCRSFTGEDSQGQGGHGLHVADTVRQVAPGVRLAFCKVLSDSGSGLSSGVAQAIRYVADMDLIEEHKGFKKVINLSLGSDGKSIDIESALEYAVSKGVFVTAAAGNDGKDVDYPGAFEAEVIAVGAVDQGRNPAGFSSPGVAVDVAGPGVKIEAAYKTGTGVLSGTSMAAPHIAGVAAIVLGSQPKISNQSALEAFLEKNAVDIHEPGRDDKTGYGLPVITNYISPVDPIPPVDPPDKFGTPWWVWVLVALFAALLLIFGITKF